MFQSRNRGSFDFKKEYAEDMKRYAEQRFQSRNRGSFDFKFIIFTVITFTIITFQSRNRGSFDFKSSEA